MTIFVRKTFISQQQIIYQVTQSVVKMSVSDINNYPSAKVQQYPTKIAFLIDCDGGLNAAFHPKRSTVIESELIKGFPPNSDIFLFYNSNDHNIVKRMEELPSKHSNVHIFPNIVANTRNTADMNLSFILGAINKKYESYVIIARYDKVYKELKERLKKANPHLENHVELKQFHGPEELAQYVRELNQAQEEEFRSVLKSAATSPIIIKFRSENLFHHCPLESWEQSSRLYRFSELLDHLNNKHPKIHYQYCPICEEMVREDDWSEDQSQLFDKHFQEEHLNNNAGFDLSIQSP